MSGHWGKKDMHCTQAHIFEGKDAGTFGLVQEDHNTQLFASI